MATGVLEAAAKKAPAAIEMQRSGQEQRLELPRKRQFAFGVLGSFEFKTAQHRFLDDWRAVLGRIEREKARYAACSEGSGDCLEKMRQWRRLIDDLKGLPPRVQVSRLNKEVNRLVGYADDDKAFGARDFWATPAESLRGRGDCEDYAILKFISLLELGFRNEQLRLTIVRDKRRRQTHAILAVQIGTKTFILDNLFNEPVEQQYVLKYVPLFSANLTDQWAHITTNKIRADFVTQTLEGAAKTTMQLASETRPVRGPAQMAQAARTAGAGEIGPRKKAAFVDWT